MSVSRYRYYQPNDLDLKDEHEDCAVRAICKVTGKSWASVFDDLVALSRQYQCMPHEVALLGRYLLNLGFTYYDLESEYATSKKKLPTLSKFTRSVKGSALVYVTEHLVAVCDGYYYDTWDSGRKRVLFYWTKEGKIF